MHAFETGCRCWCWVLVPVLSAGCAHFEDRASVLGTGAGSDRIAWHLLFFDMCKRLCMMPVKPRNCTVYVRVLARIHKLHYIHRITLHYITLRYTQTYGHAYMHTHVQHHIVWTGVQNVVVCRVACFWFALCNL